MRKLLLVVGLAACSSGAGEGTGFQNSDAGATAQKADYVGKWQFAGMTCDGKPMVITGYQETLEWNETAFHGELFSSQCKVAFDNPVKVVDGKPKAADTPKASCAPVGCTLAYSVAVGGEKSDFSKKCPDDFLTTVADPTLEFSGDTLTFTMKTGDITCASKYTRF